MIPRTPAAPGFFGSGADGNAAAGPKAIGGGGGAGEREGGVGGPGGGPARLRRPPGAPGFFGGGGDGRAAAGPKAIGGGGGAGEREGGFGGWGFVLVSFIVSTCCQERRKGSEGSGLSCGAGRQSTAPPKTFSKTSCE